MSIMDSVCLENNTNLQREPSFTIRDTTEVCASSSFTNEVTKTVDSLADIAGQDDENPSSSNSSHQYEPGSSNGNGSGNTTDTTAIKRPLSTKCRFSYDDVPGTSRMSQSVSILEDEYDVSSTYRRKNGTKISREGSDQANAIKRTRSRINSMYHSNWTEVTLKRKRMRFLSALVYLIIVVSIAVGLTWYYWFVWNPLCINLPWKHTNCTAEE
ncbi:uncharacterized protein LOC134710091 [Mytilus trossulus]|uniref:uncharacterized protein LOC134710091 n=1 Tax=Mytilus trossulus TaxID=6551 RepID=UPI00300657D1